MTTRWNYDVLMLAQRLQRWPNIKTSLFQRVMFAVRCNHMYVLFEIIITALVSSFQFIWIPLL